MTAYSDAKLKKNVETIPNALELVEKMRGVFYDRVDTGEAGVGVIALSWWDGETSDTEVKRILDIADRYGITYPLLSDQGSTVIRALGILKASGAKVDMGRQHAWIGREVIEQAPAQVATPGARPPNSARQNARMVPRVCPEPMAASMGSNHRSTPPCSGL